MLWRGQQLRAAREAVDVATGWSEVEQDFVGEALIADADRLRREADILADRIRASGLVERDSELTLLLLLAANDEYTTTPAVVGGLRHTLVRHRLIGRIAPVGELVTALAVSDDGAAIAAADGGTTSYVQPSTRPRPPPPTGQCRVSCWNADTRELIQTLWFDGRDVAALRLGPGPAGLRLTARVDDDIVAADVTTGEHVAAPNDAIDEDGSWPEAFRDAGWAEPPTAHQYAFSVPARRVVSSDSHGIAVYSVDPVDAPTPVGHVDGPVVALRWGADGTRRAVTGDGRIVDLTAGVEHGPFGTVRAVSRDAGCVLVDSPLRVRNTASGATRELDARGGVQAAGFSEDGRFLAVAGWGVLSVFAMGKGELIARFGEHDDEEGDRYTGVGLSRDGTLLVTASLGGSRAHVWDIATGTAVRRVPPVLDLSPDGADVVTRGFREVAADLSAGVEIRLYAYPEAVLVSVAPDHNALVAIRPPDFSSEDEGRAEEYTLPEGHPLFVDTDSCVCATFSPDSKQLLFARTDGRIDVTLSRHPADVVQRARR